MRFASLGSGSEGNALITQTKDTCIMLDCGFSIRETVSRLARLQLQPEKITAIIVTHEHEDHLGGVAKFASRYKIPVWLTQGTSRHLDNDDLISGRVTIIDGYSKLCIGDMEIQPFSVPHDAEEPVQYVLSDGDKKLGVLTDVGFITSHIQTALDACSALVLECNHDLEMLHNGSYPEPLKSRIAGKLGHLDNNAAADLLANLDCSRLQHLVAAHLSQKNNKPELARHALSQVLNCSEDWIGVANQDQGFGWKDIL